MKVIKKVVLLLLLTLLLVVLVGYVKAKKDGYHFYSFGMFFNAPYGQTFYVKAFSRNRCVIEFSSNLNEPAQEEESLRIGCSSRDYIQTVEGMANILDAFLNTYNIKEKLKNTNELTLQTLSYGKYYFVDLIQEINTMDKWSKDEFSKYINKNQKDFNYEKYMNSLGIIIASAKTFHPIYTILEKHGCKIKVPSNGLAIELFDRSRIGNIQTARFYEKEDLIEKKILTNEDNYKNLYPEIGQVFFELDCK